jgi:hypothetical protein
MTCSIRILASLFCVVVFGVFNAWSFSPEVAQVDIVVAPGFDHTPVRAALSGLEADDELGEMTVESDSRWVIPSVDVESREIVLSFATADLLKSSNTSTVTMQLGGETRTLFVNASLAPLNVFKLESDPQRPRLYGIHMTGTGRGALLALDSPGGGNRVCTTVGRRPTDLAVSEDGNRLYGINAVDETVSGIRLPDLTRSEKIKMPGCENGGE